VQLKGSGDLNPEDSPAVELHTINWRGRGATSNISNTKKRVDKTMPYKVFLTKFNLFR